MKRLSLNIFLDTAAFLNILALGGSGLLLAYRLPPRSGQQTAILGLTRHEWGDLHLITGITFLIIIAVHLIMHQEWIRAIFRKLKLIQFRKYRFAAAAIVAAAAVLIAGPILAPAYKTGESFGSEARGASSSGLFDGAFNLPSHSSGPFSGR